MSRMTRREASCQVWKRTIEVDCGTPLRSRVGAVLGTRYGAWVGSVLLARCATAGYLRVVQLAGFE